MTLNLAKVTLFLCNSDFISHNGLHNVPFISLNVNLNCAVATLLLEIVTLYLTITSCCYFISQNVTLYVTVANLFLLSYFKHNDLLCFTLRQKQDSM